MRGAAGDRPGLVNALRAGDDRPAAAIEPLPHEIPIGTDLVHLVGSEMLLSVDPDLGVRVRIYAADRRSLLADIATTAQHALRIAKLFQLAAERADPSLRAPSGPAA